MLTSCFYLVLHKKKTRQNCTDFREWRVVIFLFFSEPLLTLCLKDPAVFCNAKMLISLIKAFKKIFRKQSLKYPYR